MTCPCAWRFRDGKNFMFQAPHTDGFRDGSDEFCEHKAWVL